eukprot:SAG31_NODE_141_length_22675_cov_48.948879_19_plen_87_part_00
MLPGCILLQMHYFCKAKYEEEAALRRKLFNQVQELKGNIRVYCRVRPCVGSEVNEDPGICFDGPYNDLLVRNPRVCILCSKDCAVL